MTTFTEQFHAAIEAYLEQTGTKPSDFGRQAVGDPNLVRNLRGGRSPTLATADRVMTFIRQRAGHLSNCNHDDDS